MKCPNCFSNNINQNSSKPWSLVLYILCICFGGTGIAMLLGGNLSTETFVGIAMGVGAFYLAKNLTVYSFYCNNCKKKWGRTDLG